LWEERISSKRRIDGWMKVVLSVARISGKNALWTDQSALLFVSSFSSLYFNIINHYFINLTLAFQYFLSAFFYNSI